MSEDVTISVAPNTKSVGGDTVVTAPRKLGGWEDVEITLRAEAFPPTFRFAASSGMPGGRDAAMAHAGDACSIRAGKDVVATGYLTQLAGRADAGSHMVDLIGAGKTQDLAGEIEWDNTITSLKPTVDAIVQIASYFGIDVDVRPGAETLPPGSSPNLTDFPILLDFGTPAAEYVNRIARILGVLAYEAADGRLVLSKAETERATSGATYGVNVEAFQIVNSMQDRFSEIVACRFPQNVFLDGDPTSIFFYRAADPEVPRTRVRHVFLENGPDGEAFAQRMADWEVARRAARGRQVTVTVDSWRDGAGKLWMPNTIVPLDLPGLSTDAGPFGLSEVTFRQNNATGTTADMVLIPIKGFTPEPVQPSSANLAGVIGGSAS